jgi:hypothetical protein
MKMKIGIIFIATGKYYIFAKDLIESFENLFLPDHEKEYFIFTDNDNPDVQGDNIHYIIKEKEEWPFDSLHRFKNIYENKNLFSDIDFIYFLNANMKALQLINDEILPPEGCDFSAVIHPGYFMESKYVFPYERNPNSLAYVPYGDGERYYQGCFFGGRTDAFIEMCDIIAENTKKDLANNIIAAVIDESYMNKYLIDKKVMNISPVYAYPQQVLVAKEEGDPSDYSKCLSYIILAKEDPIMIQMDKRLFGGHEFLRK